jgi:hypothetical protein
MNTQKGKTLQATHPKTEYQRRVEAVAARRGNEWYQYAVVYLAEIPVARALELSRELYQLQVQRQHDEH